MRISRFFYGSVKGHAILMAAGLSTLLMAHQALAAPERMYGKGAPFTVEELPPGLLKQDLQALPGSERGKAMRQLHSFRFPASDAAVLRADQDGGIYVADMELPQPAAGESSTPTAPEAITATEAFTLHSKPGASKVIYLDFDGHVITGTAWNNNYATLYAKAFDVDGNPAVFNADELNRIAEIWHRIAEDYAAFDVDVTTEEPAVFTSHTGRLLMTEDTDENGNPMPAQGAGGVAYVNVFGRPDYPTYYSPALVYVENLSKSAPYIAEAASHEMGHNMGLSHDGVNGGTAYYPGHGSGWVSWGPIMGTGYNDNVSQWSKGEYVNANNDQDDIAIIAGKVGMRSDDHADTLPAATLLAVAEDGTVSVTSPENDPHNNNPANKGIIDSVSDVDMFGFSSGAGLVELTVTPSWLAWPRNGRGTNLDVEITLYDVSGSIIASDDPLDNTDAQISVNVPAGDYYLGITGVGNSLSPYSDYGSQGQYFISGSVPAGGGGGDTTPPNPNPMSFAEPPAASGQTSMTMTATTAVDESGGAVQYYFSCVAGGAGCTDSGWQASTSYTANGLAPDTSYSWRVRARDVAGNTTADSPSASATTDPDVSAQPPAAPSGLVVTDNTDGTASISWTDNSDNETGFEVVRETWHSKRNRWRSTTLIATTGENVTDIVDASGNGLFRYQVRAVNSAGASAYTPWVEVTVTTAGGGGGGGKGGGGGGGDGCKGGPKKCG